MYFNYKKLTILVLFVLSTLNLLSQKYNRVISLAPSITQSIYHLNAQDKLIGCTSYCEIAKDDEKNIIASAIKVNLEALLKLNPDLVIATTITNPETIEYIQKFGIKTEIFSTPKSFSEICDQFTRLGKLLGKEELAISITNVTEKTVDSLRKIVNVKTQPKVFFQIGANPIFTVLPNTFMDDYISFIGGKNISSDLNKGTITREFIITKNPDIIIITTMGITGDEEKQIWESYSNLNATKNKQIIVVDSNIACTPNPISFAETLKSIVHSIK